MQDLLNNINSFAAENRWIFWPIVGALVIPIINISKMGLKEFKNSNHPLQGLFGLIIVGGIIGLFMALLTKVIFH